MSPRGGAAPDRLRLAVALALSGTASLLLLSLLTTHPPSVAMLAAVAATVAAVVATSRSLVTPLGTPLVLPRRRTGDLPALRAGRVTDSPRHPLRPRAPGLV